MAREGVHRYWLISVVSSTSLPSSPPSAEAEGSTRAIPEKGSTLESREKGKAGSLTCPELG